MRIFPSLPAWMLTGIALSPAIYAQVPVITCRDISINSSGDFSFRASRIAAVAHGSGGLKDVADFVVVTLPVISSDGLFKDVEKILVVPGFKRIPQPSCRVYPGESIAGTVSCSASLSNTNLNVITKFKPTDSGYSEYLNRTKEIVSDIEKNVLWCVSEPGTTGQNNGTTGDRPRLK